MVGGQVGVAGLPVIRVVELVRRNVLETVHDHPQVMVENLVRELRGKNKCATSSHVLVTMHYNEYLVYLIA